LPEVEAACERVIIIHSGRIGLDKRMAELGKDTAIIVVEVRGPAEQVANVLKTTDGVAEVRSQGSADGLTAFEVVPEQDRDLREEIFQRVAKNGWGLRRLELRQRKLEDAFMAVVHREQESFFLRATQPRSEEDKASTSIKEPQTA
jgi:ABC-2 type transport system ATP-binding protein